MKEDIKFPKVEGVSVAIARSMNAEAQAYEYYVHLINENDFKLENVIISSSGYSDAQKTSVLRHYLGTVKPRSTAQVEAIDPALFALVNQFWLSYYRGKKVYDKKFLFMPDSITEENFQHVEMLDQEAVLHA